MMGVRLLPTIAITTPSLLGALLGNGLPSAQATPAPKSDRPQCSIEAQMPDQSRIIIAKARTEAISKLKSSVSSNKVNTASNLEKLNFTDAVVLEVRKQGHLFKTITVPIEGYSPVSNLTVVYTADGTISNYAESLFHRGSNGNFELNQWANGKHHQTKDLGVPYIDDSDMNAEIAKIKVQTDKAATLLSSERSFGKVAACLATVAGIGGPVAYVVAGACAGACAAPEPTVTKGICAACIGAYAALGAGGMGAAATCFQLW
ncbi:MAG: hypothetical protein Q4A71_02350 [Actinomycetaceae bacterium]|nr:hypothetical protein [Actinomycetaceae bacterium]